MQILHSHIVIVRKLYQFREMCVRRVFSKQKFQVKIRITNHCKNMWLDYERSCLTRTVRLSDWLWDDYITEQLNPEILHFCGKVHTETETQQTRLLCVCAHCSLSFCSRLTGVAPGDVCYHPFASRFGMLCRISPREPLHTVSYKPCSWLWCTSACTDFLPCDWLMRY